MRLHYEDESGTGLKHRSQHFFTLACASVDEAHWNEIDRAVSEFKRKWVPWAQPEDFELKARNIRHRIDVFRNVSRAQRGEIFIELARLIASLPLRADAVVVDKRDLPTTIQSGEQLYRIAFWQLLDALNDSLARRDESGLLMMDARSDMHSSVQDRRLVDAYRQYQLERPGKPHFVELPLFGNSEFYAGLQVADFCAHTIDVAFQQGYARRSKKALSRARRQTPEETAYRTLKRVMGELIALP